MNSIIMKILFMICLIAYLLGMVFDWLGIGTHKPVPPLEPPTTSVAETTTLPDETTTEFSETTTKPTEPETKPATEPSSVPETTQIQESTTASQESTTQTEESTTEQTTTQPYTEPETVPSTTSPVTEPSTTEPVTEPSTTAPAEETTTQPTIIQPTTTRPTTTQPTTAPTTKVTTEGTTEVEIGPQIRSVAQIGFEPYGGTGNDFFTDIDSSSDGGFVAVGNTTSKDEDLAKIYKSAWGDGTYAFIIKYDKDGNVLWNKALRTAKNSYEFNGVAVLDDGTIVAVGQIKAKDYTESSKALVVKYSANGSLLWEKTFDGNKTDIFTCVTATGNGFAVGGETDSTDSVFEGITVDGGTTAIIMNFDFDGNVLWNRYIFGNNGGSIGGIAADDDNNVFVTCISSSTDGSFAHFEGFGKGYVDTVVIKYNYKGDYIWNYVIASTARDEFGAVVANGDGGCTVAGSYELINTYKPDGTLSGLLNYGAADGLVIRIKPDGTKKWITTVAGLENDFITDIALVSDSGYAITGYSASSDRDFANSDFSGEHDSFVAFITPGGNKVDLKAQNGTRDDRAECVAYSNRGIVMALGRTASQDGTFNGMNAHLSDIYIMLFGSAYTGYHVRYRITTSKL